MPFYESTADALSGGEYISPVEYLNYYTFDEPVTAPTTLDIWVYPDNVFGGAPIQHTGAAAVRVVNNKIVEFKWADSFVEYGKAYRMDLAGAGKIVDNLGNEKNHSIFFRTPVNQAPILSFDNNHPLAPKPVAGSSQIISIEEGDLRFDGATGGILVQNESFMAASEIVPTFTVNASAQSNGIYPAATASNFYTIPGDYTLTYTLKDKENPLLMSNTLTRTYKVNGKVVFTQGNGAVRPITENFTQQEFFELTKLYPGTESEALNAYLTKKYIDTPGTNQLHAYQYSETGQQLIKAITFDTSKVSAGIMESGFNGVVFYTVAGLDDVPVLINIDGLMPTKEIIVTRPVYMTINEFSRSKARDHWDAHVVDKSNPSIRLKENVKIAWEDVDLKLFNQAQEVNLSIELEGERYVNGVDMLVQTTAVVMLQEKERYKNDAEIYRDREESRIEFWENLMTKIRNGGENRTYDVLIEYFDSDVVPADFFIVMQNQENTTVKLKYPSGIILTLKSDEMNKEIIKGISYSLRIEEMYSLYVKRDTEGQPVQEFYTDKTYKFPGTATLSMPLNTSLPKNGLSLYTIDSDKNQYVKIKDLKSSAINDDKLILELDEFLGEYIVTAVDLDGVECSKY